MRHLVMTLIGIYAVQAQITNVTDDTSTPIPGVGHDYIKALDETVNPANGSLSLRISVPMPRGRGLTMPFSFSYDSSGVYHFQGTSPGSGAWLSDATNTNGGNLSSSGWSYSAPLVTSNVVSYTWVDNNTTPPTAHPCTFSTGYVFQDPKGGRHALGLATNGQSSCQLYPNPQHNVVYAVCTGGDSQVYAWMPAAGSNCGTPNLQVSQPITISDGDGTTYTFGVGNNFFVSAEDRNGNKITSTVSNTTKGAFSFKDTLGRTVVNSSGLGPSGTTNTLTFSGMTYQVSWETVNSNFTVPFVNYSPGGDTCYPPGGVSNSLTVVKSLTLPNGKQYQFFYDPVYGLLNEIDYPSGGWVKYTYQLVKWEQGKWAGVNAAPGSLDCIYLYGMPVVASRKVGFGGSPNPNLTQTFSYTYTPDQFGAWTQKQVTVLTTDNVRGTSFTTKYFYSPINIPPPPNNEMSGPSQAPLEQMIQYYDWNATLIRTVNKTWNFNPYDLTSQQTILDNGLSSKTTFNYSYYAGSNEISHLTEKDEYDFGQSTPSRKTIFNYGAFSNTPGIIFDRPCKQTVQDGSGSPFSEADFYYDGSTTLCASETASSTTTAVTGLPSGTHDETTFGSSSTTPRGNVTKRVQWLNGGTSPFSTYSYDETGRLLTMTDPCGNTSCADMPTGSNHTTSYSYLDSYTILSGGQNVAYVPAGNTDAYLTKITDALGHSENFTYDFNTGQLTVLKDQNSQTTSYLYNDSFSRPTQFNYPDGGQTTFSYNDAAPNPTVTTSKLISAGTNLTSLNIMDGMGHSIQTQLTSDPDGIDYTDTTYDGQGHIYIVSNPHRSSSSTTDGTKTYFYDALGRTTKVSEPDGSAVNTFYSGNQTTVTDEIGNQRTSQTDGLGRLTDVWEAPNVAGYDFASHYTYDVADNLLCAVQKGTDTAQFTSCAAAPATWRPHSFIYDSLSRLTSVTNPESGTITYSYDDNGNVATKVGPRPSTTSGSLTTNYLYDPLNRLTKRSYVSFSTPLAMYGYDGVALVGCSTGNPSLPSPTNLIGRKSEICAGPSHSLFSYDPMGRPVAESRKQVASGTAYTKNTAYTYFLDGELKTETYPSNDVLTFTTSGAGRPRALSDASNSFVSPPSGVMYTPNGMLAGMINGVTGSFAGIVSNNVYNSRLQPLFLSAGVVNQSPFLSLCHDFHLGQSINNQPCSFASYSSGDNGDVFQVINNLDASRSTTFQYDSLNRIQQANTITTTGVKCWGEVYTIDAWSNLIGRSGPSGMTGCATEGLSLTASAKNQLSGLTYDVAGDVTNDGNGNTPTYDAEARIVTVAGVTYDYDAEGVRIRKNPGGLYWPDSNGNALAESDLTGQINEEYVFFNGVRIARVDRPSGTVHYYFSNRLGSHSVITSATGTCEQDIDYYPYGGVVADYCPTIAQHYKFIAKERDAESSFDNFGARYNVSRLARFMSPDQRKVSSGNLTNPQKWNKYAYTVNNPLVYFDPDGKEELEIQLRAYIPQRAVGVYKGDDRGPSIAQVVTSRTEVTFRVQTDQTKLPPGSSPLLAPGIGKAGQSENLFTGNKATQTQGNPGVTSAKYDAKGNVVVTIEQSSKMPLTPSDATPPIRSDLTLTIPADASTISTVGTVSGSPSFELNVFGEGGSATNIDLQDAPSNPLSFVAGLLQNNNILNTTELPPRPPCNNVMGTVDSCTP